MGGPSVGGSGALPGRNDPKSGRQRSIDVSALPARITCGAVYRTRRTTHRTIAYLNSTEYLIISSASTNFPS
jgi:hypothetical protein